MPKTIHKSIRLHKIQHSFRHATALYRGFVGGRGAGKTWVGAYDMLRRARRGRTYMVASPTAVLMQDTTFPTFKQIALDLGVWNPNTVKLTPYPTVILGTGAAIRFRTADNPDKLRGPNLSGVWLDEASLMEHEAYLVAIGCLREAGERGWLSATFTPKGLTHWTYEQFGQDKPDTAIFHASMQSNPFLPRGLQAQLEAQYGTRGLLAQQELGGQFVAVEGAEWPADYFTNILYTTLPPSLPIACKVISCDPSCGKDSKAGDYAAILFVILSKDGHVWVEDSIIDRMNTNAIEDTVITMNHRYLPHGVMVETVGFQDLIVDNILRKQPRIPIYRHGNTIDKVVRIRMALAPLLSHRRLHIRDTPHNRILLGQLRDFPVAEHDDGPDSLELATQMVNYLLKPRQRQPERLVVA